MKKTIISGASDDLIDISGAIEDEIQSYEGKQTIRCSDGTKATIEYGSEGTWDIDVKIKGELFDKYVSGSPFDDTPHTDDDCEHVSYYSDALILKPGITWIKIGRTDFWADGFNPINN